MRARFDNIGGLKVRAPVRSAGVAVGHVTSIRLDKKTYQGVVVMEINEGIQFPVDSSAQILTAGLLGDQYIGLEAGADDKNLKAGDMIKQTQSAVVLEKLIGQMIFNKAAEAGSSCAPATMPAAAPANDSHRLAVVWVGDHRNGWLRVRAEEHTRRSAGKREWCCFSTFNENSTRR